VTAWIAMTALGAFGALARYRLNVAFGARGTLTVNLSGAFALGVLTGAGVRGAALLVVGTGLLGAYTTFSTWMVERRYVAVSIVAGLAVAGLGWLAGAAVT
jgi:fluoride exporter